MGNKVYLHGHLGKDPELKTTPNGVALARFSVATTEKWKEANGQEKSKTEWHQCVIWNKQAEVAEKLFKKGMEIIIFGKIEYQEYTDANAVKKMATNIRVDNFEFCGKKESSKAPDPEPTGYNPGVEDDIPF